MRQITIDLTNEQIDSILINELKRIWDFNNYTGLDGFGQNIEPDFELMGHIEAVLQYYLSATDFDAWKQQR